MTRVHLRRCRTRARLLRARSRVDGETHRITRDRDDYALVYRCRFVARCPRVEMRTCNAVSRNANRRSLVTGRYIPWWYRVAVPLNTTDTTRPSNYAPWPTLGVSPVMRRNMYYRRQRWRVVATNEASKRKVFQRCETFAEGSLATWRVWRSETDRVKIDED